MNFKKILVSISMFVSVSANAGLVTLPTQSITGIRAEGNVALIGFSSPASVGSGCGHRVWVALNDEVGRAKYSLALAAFASGLQVSVRADNAESSKIYTECKMYDMVVSK